MKHTGITYLYNIKKNFKHVQALGWVTFVNKNQVDIQPDLRDYIFFSMRGEIVANVYVILVEYHIFWSEGLGWTI
jgi:hypothetical protein